MSNPKTLNLSHVIPLYEAYSHNDNEQKNPLYESLSLGFNFIEVDVRLIQGELYASHDKPKYLDKNKTLTKLYLEPLFEQFKSSEGRIFPQSNRPISLVLDIKTDKNKTYEKIIEALQPFRKMFTYWEDNVAHSSAINIILSGHRPIKKVMDELKRWVQIDGRRNDLEKGYHIEFMPLISAKFSKVIFFQFPFFDKICSSNKNKLRKLAKTVHNEGRLLRLWKCPEKTSIWNDMLEAGVDILNTDELQLMNKFLQNKNPFYPQLADSGMS